MSRKSHIAKVKMQSQISSPNLRTVPEDWDGLSSASTNTPIAPSVDLVQKRIEKELVRCAAQLDIEADELRSWLELQQTIPQKTQLHLLRTANQYLLDPLQEEVLFTQYEQSWHIAISVDGWIKIINRHPYFSGITFLESNQTDQGLPLWMECSISRTDRIMPTTVREYLSEVRQEGELWKKMPRRMLRHRTLQQCARIAMGIISTEPKEELRNTRKNTLHADGSNPGQVTLRNTQNIKQIEKLKNLLQTTSAIA